MKLHQKKRRYNGELFGIVEKIVFVYDEPSYQRKLFIHVWDVNICKTLFLAMTSFVNSGSVFSVARRWMPRSYGRRY